jgi:hypothetical protein
MPDIFAFEIVKTGNDNLLRILSVTLPSIKRSVPSRP